MPNKILWIKSDVWHSIESIRASEKPRKKTQFSALEIIDIQTLININFKIRIIDRFREVSYLLYTDSFND